MNFGTKLRKLRVEKRLSQAEVAQSIGLDQSTYSRLESDLIEPKVSTLIKIVKYYKVDITSFYAELSL